MTDTMSTKPTAHTPGHAHDAEELNPKVAADIAHWSEEFGIDGNALHELIRVHGTKISTLRTAVEAQKHGKL